MNGIQNLPYIPLYAGLAVGIIIGAGCAIVRLRDLRQQPVVDDTVNPTADSDDPEPAPISMRPVTPCRWRDVHTKHGMRKRPLPC